MKDDKNLEKNLDNSNEKLHISDVSDSMKQIISFFEKLGFSFHQEDITKEHFYMNKWLNDVEQIDAQGNENHIEVRLIGRKYVEDYKRYDYFSEDEIFQKISDWESYYH